MPDCKTPDYITGHRGPRRGNSLKAAAKAGAAIVTDETGEPVKYDREGNKHRPWRVIGRGKNYRRFDSYEVHPEF